ncbi:hypothetical protein FA13DRAFT_1706800 [Coprinellus micaceus]|uniref:Uncharacterized protein n=1 Tax=Coprinellus micaceus TaxID=71717 RepID=A0A4Y7TNM9_COPMI|nr:hypothetical protein FA13DRAFT_1706800 [Coprinellus micaceus]
MATQEMIMSALFPASMATKAVEPIDSIWQITFGLCSGSSPADQPSLLVEMGWSKPLLPIDFPVTSCGRRRADIEPGRESGHRRWDITHPPLVGGPLEANRAPSEKKGEGQVYIDRAEFIQRTTRQEMDGEGEGMTKPLLSWRRIDSKKEGSWPRGVSPQCSLSTIRASSAVLTSLPVFPMRRTA